MSPSSTTPTAGAADAEISLLTPRRMLTFKPEQLRLKVAQTLGEDKRAALDAIAFLPFDDLEGSVRDDVRLVQDHPLLKTDSVTGWIYDVKCVGPRPVHGAHARQDGQGLAGRLIGVDAGLSVALSLYDPPATVATRGHAAVAYELSASSLRAAWLCSALRHSLLCRASAPRRDARPRLWHRSARSQADLRGSADAAELCIRVVSLARWRPAPCERPSR